MQAMASYDYLFQVLLVGDASVGKNAILFRFSDDAFISSFISTIGINFKLKTIELQGRKIKLQFWDTAGEERLRERTRSYYRAAMGIMLIYDVTNEKTFENIPNWLRYTEERLAEDVEKMILGNNSHMDDRRVVSKERGEQLAKELGAQFFEVSTTTNINIEEACYNLAEKMLEKKLSTRNEETSQNIRVSDTEEKKGRCY